jgi:TonB family protein
MTVSRRVMASAVVLAATRATWLAAQEKVVQVTESQLRAAVIRKVEPEYPAVARQIRLTGEVELEVVVDLTGAVEKVTVRRGNTLLSGSGVQAIKKWKFNPFRADGQPARAVGPIKFSFQI